MFALSGLLYKTEAKFMSMDNLSCLIRSDMGDYFASSP